MRKKKKKTEMRSTDPDKPELEKIRKIVLVIDFNLKWE